MKASNLIRAVAAAAAFLAMSSGASAQSLLSTANVDVLSLIHISEPTRPY